jgi:hypothetical protein
MGAMPLFLLVRYGAGKVCEQNEMEPECDEDKGLLGMGKLD